MSETQDIRVQTSFSHILRLALPIAVAILIPQVSMLTNTVFLGYYQPGTGEYDTQHVLAASGIAGIFYLTLVMIGYGLSSGILMLMSRRAGANDSRGLGAIFSNGTLLALGVSIVLMLLTASLAPAVFRLAIHDEPIREAATEFIRIRLWGLPFILLCQLGNSLFLATSRSRFIAAGTAVQTGTNILFDYLLIFGIGPFPEMGLNGTALASVLSELFYMITVLLIIQRAAVFRPYQLRFFGKPDSALLRESLYKSLPLILQHFLSIGAWELFFIYVEHLGKTESAISQVLRSVFGLVGVLAWALASTCNAMVSNLIGQKREGEVMGLVGRITAISFGFAFVAGSLLLCFPRAFLGLLTADAALIEAGLHPLRIVVLATWMLSVSTIFFNAVLGTGNTRLNMIFEFVAIVFYVVYITVVVEWQRLSLSWAWASEFVYWLTLFALSAWYLRSGRWKSSATA